MPKDQFAHEAPLLAHLLDCLRIKPNAAPSLSFGELMARAHEAARFGEIDAWTDGEVQKALAEMRATTSEGA